MSVYVQQLVQAPVVLEFQCSGGISTGSVDHFHCPTIHHSKLRGWTAGEEGGGREGGRGGTEGEGRAGRGRWENKLVFQLPPVRHGNGGGGGRDCT